MRPARSAFVTRYHRQREARSSYVTIGSPAAYFTGAVGLTAGTVGSPAVGFGAAGFGST